MTRPYGLAASLIFVSALLLIYGGFTTAPMPLLPIAAGYLVLMAAITRGWRSVAWLAFFVTACGAIGAIAYIWSSGAWWVSALAISNGLAFFALFGSLWRAPAATQS